MYLTQLKLDVYLHCKKRHIGSFFLLFFNCLTINQKKNIRSDFPKLFLTAKCLNSERDIFFYHFLQSYKFTEVTITMLLNCFGKPKR